ncbi:MAG: dethiobiotin synthase, partial [Planctomycetes bacterium]|nr:dethiobiotin synthase [Planctomycetota bacterium]
MMDLPKAKGLFITGTDTGVGKTLVAGGIARVLSEAGHRVGVFKPVASGCRKEREGLVSDDAEFLAHCSNCDLPLSVINPVTFITPAAPVLCEGVERCAVDFEQIAVSYRCICKESDFVIVEGIGGMRVPISRGVDVGAMAAEFGLPVVLVSRPGLGTINHTLLSIDSIRAAGLRVAGVVISGYDLATAGLAEETAPGIIAEWGQVDVLTILSFDEESCVERGQLGEMTAEALGECDWVGLCQ